MNTTSTPRHSAILAPEFAALICRRATSPALVILLATLATALNPAFVEAKGVDRGKIQLQETNRVDSAYRSPSRTSSALTPSAIHIYGDPGARDGKPEDWGSPRETFTASGAFLAEAPTSAGDGTPEDWTFHPTSTFGTRLSAQTGWVVTALYPLLTWPPNVLP